MSDVDGDNDGTDELPTPAPRHRRHHQPGRDHRVLLRLSEKEYADLAAASDGTGLTPTGFAADAAMRAAKGKGMPDHGPLRLALLEYMASRTQLRRAGVNLNQAVAQLHVAQGNAAAFAQLAKRVERVAGEVEKAVAHNDEAAADLAAILLRGRR